ncbi:MAG TPA: DUF488 domain-containing protein, partial [Phycisphaerae bacterium]|nr:DUF488 domain-containing protein [Phycisphaerae bacterium]
RRREARKAAYTVGYEGWLADGFLNALLRAGIRCVVDVRHNPTSRRYGFHKSTLAKLCAEVGIDYDHRPELGIPPEHRRSLRSNDDYEKLFEQYETDTLPRQAAALQAVAGVMGSKPTALMCAEADPERCHRSRLARAIAERTGLSVCNLGGMHGANV